MINQPQTWHYGLVARWWAEFNEVEPDELGFYRDIIADNGQPALDLACGAGRLLVPLLRAGLDVDGADISHDMLAHCRAIAARDGLVARLFQGAMHEVALPRQYRTIFICDSFGIGGDRTHDLETLHRCYRQLAAGGRLVYSHYDNPEEWQDWTPEQQAALPEPWPETDLRKQAADSDEISFSTRLVDLDQLAQRQTRQIRSRLWRNGEMIQEEEGFLVDNIYFRNELLLLLKQAGFTSIEMRAGYTADPATAANTMLVFIARKL